MAFLNMPKSITAPLPLDDLAWRMGTIPNIYETRRDQDSLQLAFRKLVEQWKDDTQHLSSVTKMIAHPNYLRVVGLARKSTGTEIERLLLCELETEPDYWFDALSAITGEDPVTPGCDFDQSVEAWLEWGRRKGIISA